MVTELNSVCVIGVFCALPKVGIDLVRFLRDLSSQQPERAFIVVGDFFFGPRLSDSSYGKALRALSENGWVSAWDAFHPGEEWWSCQTSRGKSRPDNFYLYGSVIPKIQQVDTSPIPLLERLSDHPPVIARFAWGPSRTFTTARPWPRRSRLSGADSLIDGPHSSRSSFGVALTAAESRRDHGQPADCLAPTGRWPTLRVLILTTVPWKTRCVFHTSPQNAISIVISFPS